MTTPSLKGTDMSKESKDRMRDPPHIVSCNTGSRNLSYDFFDISVHLIISGPMVDGFVDVFDFRLEIIFLFSQTHKSYS